MCVLFTGGYGRFCAGNHRLATSTAWGSLLECGQGRPSRFHRPPEVSLRPDESVEAGRPTRFHRPPEVSLRPDESVEAEILKFTSLQSCKCPTRSPKYPFIGRSRQAHRPYDEPLRPAFYTLSPSRVRWCCHPQSTIPNSLVESISTIFDAIHAAKA